MNSLLPAPVIWVLMILTSGCLAQTQRNSPSQDAHFRPAAGPPIDVGGRPNEIAVADWNRDGKLDVVTCNDGDTLTVLLGDGRGGFTPAPGSPIKAAAHLMAVGDVNKDRNPDLALTHHDSFGVVLLLGADDGRFAPAPGSPFAAHRGAKAHNHGLALNDLNRDGSLDLTTSNQDDNSVSVLLGDGRGGFTPAAGSPFAVGRSPYPHAVGDLNGDALPDLITTHDDISLMTTLLGDGRGGFAAAPASPFNLGRRAYKLVAADVDGDGRADMVVGTEGDDSVAVLLGNERGGYTPAAGSPYRAGQSPRVAVGDVNNDGRPDLITANQGSGNITVLLGK